jgi:hypothetical protein
MAQIDRAPPHLVAPNHSDGDEDLDLKKTKTTTISSIGLTLAAKPLFSTILAHVYQASYLDHFRFRNVFDNKLNEEFEKPVRIPPMRCDRKSYEKKTWNSRRRPT